jgi:hypothetical protein
MRVSSHQNDPLVRRDSYIKSRVKRVDKGLLGTSWVASVERFENGPLQQQVGARMTRVRVIYKWQMKKLPDSDAYYRSN